MSDKSPSKDGEFIKGLKHGAGVTLASILVLLGVGAVCLLFPPVGAIVATLAGTAAIAGVVMKSG